MLKKFSNDDIRLLQRLVKENIKQHKKLYIKAIISMIFLSVSTAASAWIMRDFINNLLQVTSFKVIIYISLSIIAIFTIKGLSSYFQIYYLSRAGNAVIAEQQRKIYHKLSRQATGFFQNNKSSDLLIRLTHSINQLRTVIDILITTYIRDLLSLIALLFVMFYSNIYLSIIGLLLGPSVYYLVSIGLKKIRSLASAEMQYHSEIIQVMQETAQGIKVIKAFNLENIMTQRMNEAIDNLQRRSNQIAKLQALTSPIMESLAGFAIAISCLVTGELMLQKSTSCGDLVAFITSLILAYEPAKRLANSRLSLQSNLVGVKMLFDIIDAPLQLTEAKNAKSIADNNATDIIVEFSNVSFAYPHISQDNAQNHMAINNINFKIIKGTTTAIVGPSGAGKSSIVNLLLRLYDPQQGQIFINGQDIRYSSFESLRKHISYVGQESFLFNNSIKYNIELGKANSSFAEIIEAAKLANAHDFIMQLPQKYDTIIGAEGIELSGGQKQRISLSRALLKKSPILILDEATSALDAICESEITQALEQIGKNYSIIAIAHRFSTIAKADNIIVIENGQVIQQGNIKQLLEQEDGLFKKLYDSQYLPLQQQAVIN